MRPRVQLLPDGICFPSRCAAQPPATIGRRRQAAWQRSVSESASHANCPRHLAGAYTGRWLAAGCLSDLQAAQSGKWNIKIAYLTCTLANPVQHFEEFLLVAVAIGNDFFEQSLQPSASRAEGVDVLRVLSGRRLQQSPLHLPKHEFATFGCNRHKETNPGSGRRSILRSLKNHGLAVSNNSEFKLIDGTAD